MTGNGRQVAARTLGPLLGISGVTAMLLLGGCTGFKQVVGLEALPPDEFAVESRAPLTVPPEFDLRPPAPGTPRPQEASAASKAQQAVNAAGPGKPGDQANNAVRVGGPLGGGPDPNQSIGPDSLARKLLLSGDVDTGVAIEKRETTPLQGVY
jgi:hypothetical protein